jgi:hypothetical protein
LGLKHCHQPHILDTCQILHPIWKEFDPNIIAKCWIKSSILLLSHEEQLLELVNEHKLPNSRETAAASKDNLVNDLVDLYSLMHLQEGCQA